MKPNACDVRHAHFFKGFGAKASSPARRAPMPPSKAASWGAWVAACLFSSVALAQPAAQSPAAGTVATATSVEGTAYVTRADGRQTILARGSALAVGDALSTSRNTTVRLRFTDGGETAVRPDSRITVQSYVYKQDEPQSDSLILGLLKGGLRAITGAIGKRGNVDAYRLNVNVATIGIRGTDYTARLCNDDCTSSATVVASNSRGNAGPTVVARVVQAQGPVTVQRDSRQVDVTQGAALYATDRIATAPGGHAVLAFRDDTRLTLNSGTQLALTQYTYDQAQPARNNILFRLISGGLRIATGLISKSSPSQVRFQTATATIGIRGTVFDIVCGRANPGDDPPVSELTDVACDEALFATTRAGEITLAGSDGREVVVGVGQSAVVPGAQGPARALVAPPAFFNSLSTPAPEAVQVNLEQLFGGQAPPADNASGVYLMVREGKVTMDQSGQSLVLDAGESAFAGPGQSTAPIRLTSTPPLLDRDVSLSNAAFNVNVCRR